MARFEPLPAQAAPLVVINRRRMMALPFVAAVRSIAVATGALLLIAARPVAAQGVEGLPVLSNPSAADQIAEHSSAEIAENLRQIGRLDQLELARAEAEQKENEATRAFDKARRDLESADQDFVSKCMSGGGQRAACDELKEKDANISEQEEAKKAADAAAQKKLEDENKLAAEKKAEEERKKIADATRRLLEGTTRTAAQEEEARIAQAKAKAADIVAFLNEVKKELDSTTDPDERKTLTSAAVVGFLAGLERDAPPAGAPPAPVVMSPLARTAPSAVLGFMAGLDADTPRGPAVPRANRGGGGEAPMRAASLPSSNAGASNAAPPSDWSRRPAYNNPSGPAISGGRRTFGTRSNQNGGRTGFQPRRQASIGSSSGGHPASTGELRDPAGGLRNPRTGARMYNGYSIRSANAARPATARTTFSRGFGGTARGGFGRRR
jgi:hypothetical protein